MKRRAFTLWEMLTVIILTGAIGLILSRLFVATHRVIDTAPKAHDEIVRIDAMLRQMRQDVWESREVRVESAQKISTDKAVWTIDKDAIVRVEADDRQDWAHVDAAFAFASSPAGVLLRNQKAGTDADDSILMASHAKLLSTNGGAR